MFFSLAFLMVAGLATIMHGDCVTEIVGSCQDLEATLTIKYLLFSFTSLYSLVGVTRGCKGQSSTYFISIIFVDGFRWTHWEERRSFSATMSTRLCASGSEEKAWSWTTRSRANASGRKTRLFVLRRHRHRRMSVGVKEPVCHVIMSR